jgi:hypothetical protein
MAAKEVCPPPQREDFEIGIAAVETASLDKRK